MKNTIFLEYTFLFDADNTWQHLSQFESELAEFFGDKGFSADILKSISGQSGRRILLIKKVDPIEEIREQSTKDPGKQLKEYANRKLRTPAVKFMKGNK